MRTRRLSDLVNEGLLTARRADHWATKGYIAVRSLDRLEEGPSDGGSGSVRILASAVEEQKVRLMVRLVDEVGFTVEAAAVWAEKLAHGQHEVELARGLTLRLSTP